MVSFFKGIKLLNFHSLSHTAVNKFLTTVVVLVKIPTERRLMEKDSVEFSASVNGMGRANMRIPSEPIRNQMIAQGIASIRHIPQMHVFVRLLYSIIYQIPIK